jgi:hypothetical protein
MSDRFLRAVLALYPRGFRRRYGTEVQDLVNDLEAAGDSSRLSLIGGLLISAVTERLRAVPLDIRLTVPTLLAVAALGTAVGLKGSRSGQRSPRAVASAGTHVWRAFKASTRLGSGTLGSGETAVEAVPMRLRNGWPVAESTPPPPPPSATVEGQG